MRVHKTALDRAREAWQGHANLVRGELRSRGVTGTMPRLDRRACGDRGASVVQQLFADAVEEAAHGLPLDVAIARTAQVVEWTVRLAYQQYDYDAKGGPSAA